MQNIILGIFLVCPLCRVDSADQLSQFHVVTDDEADFEPSANFKHLCQRNTEISSDKFTNTAINWERFSGNFREINTFTAIVDLSRFNNSCLKSPASTLVDLTFQSRGRSALSA